MLQSAAASPSTQHRECTPGIIPGTDRYTRVRKYRYFRYRGIRDLRTQIPRKIPADRERKVASSFSVLWIPRWPLYLKKNRGAMGSRTCLTLRDPSPGPGIVPARLGRYKDPAFPRHWRILRGRGFFLRATGHPPSHPSTSPGFFHTFLADRYLTGPGFNTAHIFLE